MARVGRPFWPDPGGGWPPQGGCGGGAVIANDQEFAMVSRQLQELKARRDKMLREGVAEGFQLHVEVAGVEKMIARLQEEIDTFESSKRGKVTVT